MLGGDIRIAASGPAGTTFEVRIPGRAAGAGHTSEALVAPPASPSVTVH